MEFQPIDPNIVPLIQGLKPYLGSRGQVLAEGATSLVNLLASHHGKEAIRSVSNIFTAGGKGDKIVTVDTAAGPVSLSLSMAAVMFLIFILLILSGNLLALTPGGYGGYPGNTAVSEDIASV